MVQSLENSIYSFSFTNLMLMGAWAVDPKHTFKDRLYAIHKTLMTLISFCAVLFLVADLCEIFGDIQKTSWNLCISTLFAGSLMKLLLIFFNYPILNDLRQKLHEDAESRTVSQHLLINELALKEFKFLRIVLYTGCCVFIPIWLVNRYPTNSSDSRDLPLPMRFPFAFDKDNDLIYNLLYVTVGSFGTFGLYFIVQGELCMFSILIQITREYWILIRDISLLGDMSSEIFAENGVSSSKKKEINPILKNTKIKNYLRYIYRRQQTLIQYTEVFERCYSGPMILQFCTVSIVLTVVGIQLILIPLEFSGYVSFQLGYTSIVIMDYFLLCWFATRLKSLCYQVGEVAYDSLWYKMGIDCQKDLTMLIMRSQRPPRVTTGKMMEVNLNAFVHALRNIYSWLTIFRELEVKGT